MRWSEKQFLIYGKRGWGEQKKFIDGYEESNTTMHIKKPVGNAKLLPLKHRVDFIGFMQIKNKME